ncbi:MAG: molybdopterin-guanine dinucleotide biosynthesis protein B [Acidimicrobiia bacterium]|nr:molybdopterin-guanine dinucleotide biosynthesis protein B [Acidimicrobiia bacterium]
MVSIVGASGSGKTHLVERLVPVLRERGLDVATVKHASHGFDLDTDGTDSDRHRRAGASSVMLVGPERIAVDTPAGPSLGVLVSRLLPAVDVVLAEGFGTEPGPKLLVHRRGIDRKPQLDSVDVLAAVTDEPLGFPREIHPDDVGAVASLVAERALPQLGPRLTIVVDDVVIPIDGFAEEVVARGLLGMVTTLKGVAAAPARVEISLTCR